MLKLSVTIKIFSQRTDIFDQTERFRGKNVSDILHIDPNTIKDAEAEHKAWTDELPESSLKLCAQAR